MERSLPGGGITAEQRRLRVQPALLWMLCFRRQLHYAGSSMVPMKKGRLVSVSMSI